MPAQALSAVQFDCSTFHNYLTKDATLLPDLHMNEELSLRIQAIGSQQRLAPAETAKLTFTSHRRIMLYRMDLKRFMKSVAFSLAPIEAISFSHSSMTA